MRRSTAPSAKDCSNTTCHDSSQPASRHQGKTRTVISLASWRNRNESQVHASNTCQEGIRLRAAGGTAQQLEPPYAALGSSYQFVLDAQFLGQPPVCFAGFAVLVNGVQAGIHLQARSRCGAALDGAAWKVLWFWDLLHLQDARV